LRCRPLKRAGYCVYALDYGARDDSGLLGMYGIGEIERSARELRDFVADVPHTSGFLAPDANVTNVTLQDVCPGDTSEHLRIPYDPPAIALTRNALGRPGPADPGFRPACTTF
jgi:hypothetical protein